jgi:hypothetical protein
MSERCTQPLGIFPSEVAIMNLGLIKNRINYACGLASEYQLWPADCRVTE